MAHWVYIYQNEAGELKTGVSPDTKKMQILSKKGMHLSYVRSFNEKVEAKNHKNQLDQLPDFMIKYHIHEHRMQTDFWLKAIVWYLKP